MSINYANLSNNELCKLYKHNDDQKAFNTLYVKLDPLVTGRLKQLIKHDENAFEELSQIIWLEAARAIRNSFKFESDFSTYLYTITTTRFINYFRSYKTSFMDEQQADKMNEVLYSGALDPIKGDIKDNMKGTFLHSLISASSNVNMSMTDDVLDAYRTITLEVLSEYSEDEQRGYLCRVDNKASMNALSRELNIPYTRIKEVSKTIEDEINRRLKEYVEHYY